MAFLQGEHTETTVMIRTEFGCWEFLNDQDNQNKKASIVFLRSWRVPETGKPLFTYQQIADALAYKDRRDVNNYWREFEARGGTMLGFLTRKRKVDVTVVDAVAEEVGRDILASAPQLCERVSERLGRRDLTSENIRTALEEVPCTVVRRELRSQWEAGTFHPKESVILEEALATLSHGHDSQHQIPAICSRVEMPPDDGESVEAIVQKGQDSAVADLLNPQVPVSHIPPRIRKMVMALTLYFWNVPFSRIALWLNISKGTAYHWVIGLAVALFPRIHAWLEARVKMTSALVDEKWVKIRQQWHYWFVALDEATELPVFSHLLPTRTKWACCWFLVLLKRIGKVPRAVMTDALLGYPATIAAVFPKAKHLLCVFHHQQGVTRWLREHAAHLPAETLARLKQKMKHVIATCDPRTVRRRLHCLANQDAERQWGIGSWLSHTRKRLSQLLPALRRNQYPRTNNAIERFFRAFQRFYTTRGGFHSVVSARRELMLFVVVYVFTKQADIGIAPIERIVPQASQMPLYKLLNDPFKYGLVNIC